MEPPRPTQMLSLPPWLIAALDQARMRAKEEVLKSIVVVPENPNDLRQVRAAEFIEAALHNAIMNDQVEFPDPVV